MKHLRWLVTVFTRFGSTRYICLPEVSISHACKNDASSPKKKRQKTSTLETHWITLVYLMIVPNCFQTWDRKTITKKRSINNRKKSSNSLLLSHTRYMACAIQFPSKVVKASLDWGLLENLQLICRGELHLEPKLKKKKLWDRFWAICDMGIFHIFLVCRKSVLEIFLFQFAWMINQSHFLISDILRWGHMGRFWEECHLTY